MTLAGLRINVLAPSKNLDAMQTSRKEEIRKIMLMAAFADDGGERGPRIHSKDRYLPYQSGTNTAARIAEEIRAEWVRLIGASVMAMEMEPAQPLAGE